MPKAIKLEIAVEIGDTVDVKLKKNIRVDRDTKKNDVFKVIK